MTTVSNRMPGSETPLTALTGDQLRARVAQAQLFLIDMAPARGATFPLAREQAEANLRYLHKLEREGRLYGCGPLDAVGGQPAHDLAIIAATSRSEAEHIACSDPLHVAGIRQNTIRTHIMNEGVACYVGRALFKRLEGAVAPFDPDVSGIDLSYEQLAGRAVGALLHLIWLEPTEKRRPPEDTQTGIDHFVWLRDNEMKAKLMSCGPVEPVQPLQPGIWGGGLGVFATSRNEAEAIAAAEPSGCAGYRRLTVMAWTLNYGIAAPIGKSLEAVNRLR